MKKSLLIIAVACATSTSLLATTLSKLSAGYIQSDNITIADYTYSNTELAPSVLSASISKVSLSGGLNISGDSQKDEFSGTESTPYMNRPGGSYTRVPENISRVPDGGLTALLLALGMSGLILLARKHSVVRKCN